MTRSQLISHQNALSGECGTLQVTITVKSPLHFGQAKLRTKFESGAQAFVHALCRENGRIALPGSSLKGMLRAFFEAISCSCMLFPMDNYQMQWGLPITNRSTCTPKDGVCPACSVFGCLGYKGKLGISSFYANEDALTQNYDIPQLQAPFRDYPDVKKDALQRGRGNERLYYGVLPGRHGPEIGNMSKEQFFQEKKNKVGTEIRFYGRKFYKHARKVEPGDDQAGNTFECLEPGTMLRGKIHYQGMDKDELAALAFALGMGWQVPIYHKLGYAKPAYYGSVSLHTEAVLMPNRYESMGFHRDTQWLEDLAAGYKKKASKDVLSAIQTFEQVWTSLDEPSQWALPQEGGNKRMY